MVMTDNYQGTAVMNYTEEEIPYTRIVEHKHFENIESDCTHITFEYPVEYKSNKTEPMYPVNDDLNNQKYLQYKNLAEHEKDIIFGGRLAEYKYYDMHQVIESALNKIKTIQ
jgi:UDP-galactopyranose mutase